MSYNNIVESRKIQGEDFEYLRKTIERSQKSILDMRAELDASLKREEQLKAELKQQKNVVKSMQALLDAERKCAAAAKEYELSLSLALKEKP